jgi:PAS domain S-box-containing protein
MPSNKNPNKNSIDHEKQNQDLKQAEAALRESEDRFRKIVEQAPIAMAIVGMDGAIEFINKKAVTVFGYLPEDIPTMDRWWIQAYPNKAYRTEVVADWMGRIQKALTEGGEIAGNEYRVTCKNGAMKTMFISGVPVSGKIFVLFDNITERKQAEESLRKSEERYRLLHEYAPIGILLASRSGQILEVNSAAIQILGSPSVEATKGINLLTFPLLVQAGISAAFKTCVETGQVVSNEYPYTTKWGKFIHQLLRFVPIFDDRGRVNLVHAIIEDITERKRMEEELQKSQKLESLGLLAGGIAHDFNNLLTGIFGYIDLARSVSKDSRAIEYLEATLSTMTRARALTLQLLTFAKGGSPVQKLTPLIPFIQEAANFALSGSNILCRFDLADNLWPCNIDKNQIGQVIDNIVINAQQAMPNGDGLEISARNAALGKKGHPSLAEGHYVKVSIKDTGIGIPKDVMPRIFDPFYTTKTKGHGLGLATSYSIVKRHGGCIDVESEPGKGSTFHVYLPASPKVAVADKAAGASHKGSGTVLVMDDEEVVRTSVGKMLESLGYIAECKNNGKEALDFFINETGAKRTFAAMIFDLTIPGGMGGIEAVGEIRKLNKEIPVFVMSGYADNSTMKNPLDYGFTASIPKPFTIAELSEMLNRNGI